MKEKLKSAASATGYFFWEILSAVWDAMIWVATLEWLEDTL